MGNPGVYKLFKEKVIDLVDKVACEKRRNELKEMIAENGVWSINKQKMGRKYGVTGVQIARDIETILKDVPVESVQSIVSSLEPYFKRAIKKANEVMESSNAGLQVKGITALTNAITQYTTFLEAWGKKQKTPDEVNVTDKTIHFTYSMVDIVCFLEWCKANKKEFVVKIFERYEKIKAREEERKQEERKDNELLRKPLNELVSEPAPVPMTVIVNGIEGQQTETEEKKPCVDCADKKVLVKCFYCGKIHVKDGMCFKRLEYLKQNVPGSSMKAPF